MERNARVHRVDQRGGRTSGAVGIACARRLLRERAARMRICAMARRATLRVRAAAAGCAHLAAQLLQRRDQQHGVRRRGEK
jgi:hypothetical protein